MSNGHKKRLHKNNSLDITYIIKKEDHMNNSEKRDTSTNSDEFVKKQAHDAVSVYLFNPDRTHVLMLFHKKLQVWLPPGGHTDDDLPQHAAIREVAEETGIEDLLFFELDSGILHIDSPDQKQLDIDETIALIKGQITKPFAIVQEKILGSPKEPEHEHIDYVYVGQTNTSSQNVRIDLRESEDQQWLPLTQQTIRGLRTFPNVKAILERLYEFRKDSSI